MFSSPTFCTAVLRESPDTGDPYHHRGGLRVRRIGTAHYTYSKPRLLQENQEGREETKQVSIRQFNAGHIVSPVLSLSRGVTVTNFS